MRAPAHPEEAMLIGIDVGGTKTAIGCVAHPSGEVLEKRIELTPDVAASGAPFIARLCGLARMMKDEAAAAGWQCRGIGISLCELVDLAGEPSSGYRVEWRNAGALTAFGDVAPAVIEADVRAAAFAEARIGRGKPYAQFAYVNLGTGVSSCLVLDGTPHAGARGNALVLGIGPALNVGADGTTSTYIPEELAGGAGMVARYNALGHGVTSALDILAHAQAGGEDARAIVSLGGKVAGAAIGFLVNVLDPEAVIVGGGLGIADGLYWQELVASARETIWSEEGRDLPILHAGLGAESGLIGAAMVAATRQDHQSRKNQNRAGRTGPEAIFHGGKS